MFSTSMKLFNLFKLDCKFLFRFTILFSPFFDLRYLKNQSEKKITLLKKDDNE